MGMIHKSALVVMMSLCCALCTSAADAKPARVVTILQDLIRANTVNPPGNEIRAVEIIEKWIREVPALESQRFESTPGRTNLLIRLAGDGSGPATILLGHLDVVTADAEQWLVPPFAALIQDGFVWGRGAMDMKGMVAMELEALLQLAESRRPLDGDVILLAVADEEAGGALGAGWLTEHHPELFKSGWVLNEGSIGFRKSDYDIFPVQVAEKGVCWMKLTARGDTGHGSMPHDNNAVLKISEAITRLGETEFPMTGTPITRTLLRSISQKTPYPEKFVLGNLFTPLLGTFLRPLVRSSIRQERILFAMLTNTVTPTQLEAGSKINVIPSTAVATVDARILPGETPEGFKAQVQKIVGPDIEIEIVTSSMPNESSFDSPYYRTIATVLNKYYPEAVVAPVMSTGATDSRFFRALGLPAYGIIPVLIPETDIEGLHGHNERISVAGLSVGVEIIKDIIREVH